MKKFVTISLISLLLISGCSLFYSLFFKEPEVLAIKKISVLKVDHSGALINVILAVANDNDNDINILECNYSLYVNDAFIGKGLNDKNQVLFSNDTSEIVMPLEVKTSDLTIGALKIFEDIISGKELLYSIEGEVRGESYGIEIELPIKIKKKLQPEIN